MTDPYAEAAWVRDARAGSAAAFGRLVQMHQQALRAFLRRLCGHAADADDLAQESFVFAWEHIGRFDPARAFRPWLFGIAWRKAQTAGRSAVRAARRDGEWASEETPAEGIGAEDRLALEAALAELAPDQRAAVTLCLGEGWTHEEAARTLDLPLGTVKSHVARGRDRLLASLGERA